MNKTTTVLLLAVLAALLAIVYFTKGAPEKNDRGKEKMIAGYAADKLTSIRIENGERNEKVLFVREKAGADWELQEPIRVAADKVAADFLARFFEDFEGTRIGKSGDSSVNIESLGLKSPRAILEFGGLGPKPVVVRIGADNPLKSGDLFLLIEDVVYQAPRTIYNSIAKPSYKFRDDRVFTIPAGELAQITIQYQGASTTLELDGTEWRIAAPFKGRAESGAAGKIINIVGALRVTTFENDNPVDLLKYKLDAPPLVMTVRSRDKSETVKFGQSDDGSAFAMREGVRSVWRVPAADIDPARLGAEQLRDPDAFGKFVHDQLKSVKWRIAGGAEMEVQYDSLARRARLTKPVEAEMDRLAYDELLKSLDGLSAASIEPAAGQNLADLGLEPESSFLEISLKGASEPIRLSVGGKGADAMMKRRKDEYLLRMAPGALAMFQKPVSAFASKDIVSIDSFNAGRVELDVTKDGVRKSLVFAKNEANKWTLAGAATESVEFANLSDLLWHAKAAEVTDLDIKNTPLATPSIEIRIYKKLFNDPKGVEKEKDRIGTMRFARDGAGGWLANGIQGAAIAGGFVMKVAAALPEQVEQFVIAGTAK